MSPEELYMRLGQLLAEAPDLSAVRISNDARMWLGRAYALANEAGQMIDAVDIRMLSATLNKEGDSQVANQLFQSLYRVLAHAEMKAPPAVKGGFIPAGNAFDAVAAIGKVFTQATASVRIVDPYMDEKALTDFGVLVPERVSLELLSDPAFVKASLRPTAARWSQQYSTERPLEVRLTAPKALHDRLIIIDNSQVWTISQSLNAFAARSPATIMRVDPETSKLKIDAYNAFWASAESLETT